MKSLLNKSFDVVLWCPGGIVVEVRLTDLPEADSEVRTQRRVSHTHTRVDIYSICQTSYSS